MNMTSKTGTDLQDMNERFNEEAAENARGERADPATFSAGIEQVALQLHELWQGFPGFDGTEWGIRGILEAQLNHYSFKLKGMEENVLHDKKKWLNIHRTNMQKAEKERTSLEGRSTYDERGNEFIQQSRAETTAAYDANNVSPRDKYEQAKDDLRNAMAFYDYLQAAFHATHAVYVQDFGTWVPRGQEPVADVITAEEDPELAALMQRVDTVSTKQEKETPAQKLNRQIREAAEKIAGVVK